jgi:hypothetical protein
MVLLATSAGLAGSPTASAQAPNREIFEGEVTRVDEFCGFPVLAQSEGRFAVISFTDAEGNIVKTIEPVAGRLQTSVTNVNTGKTLQLHVSGPGILELDASGQFVSFTTLGAWFVTQDPGTFERGAFILRGRRQLTTNGFEFHGRVVDLCAELAL